MASSFILNADTVKFYKDSVSEDNLLDGCSYTYDKQANTVKFTVPNYVHVIITYSVTIDADPIANPFWNKDTDNTVQLEAFEQYNNGTTVNFAKVSTGIKVWAYNTDGDITIHKYWNNGGKLTALKGAEFSLYSVYDNNGHIYQEGDDGYLMRSGIEITDDTGNITVDGLPLDRIYKLVETKSPDGYLDGEEYYFVLQGHYGVEIPEFLEGTEIEEFRYGEAAVINYENVKETTIEGTKTWSDVEAYKSDYRPDSITLNLYRKISGGEEEQVELDADSITWDKTTDANTWSYTISDLPEYDADGNTYTYRVEEVEVNGYETKYEGDLDENITNTLKTVEISGTKTWENDGAYKADVRPESIKLDLYANGEKVSDTKYTVEWSDTDTDKWSYTIENLPQVDGDGKDIVYTVEEESVNGYVASYSNDSLDIVNTYQLTDVSGKKTWSGDNLNVRPENVTLVLLADGEEVEFDYTVEWSGKDTDEWSYVISDLPLYNSNGEEVVYTVVETDVAEGYTPIYDESKLNIENSYEVPRTGITGTKEWKNDEAVKENSRPDYIDITLLANGEPASFDYQVIWSDTDKDLWSYEIDGLPTRDEEGNIIVYSVEEEEVPLGYTSAVYGFDIVNTFTDDKVSVSGTKTWVGDTIGNRPEDITLKLYSEDEGEVDAQPVWSDKDTDFWSYTFENLDKYRYSKDADGEISRSEINYFVREDELEKYIASYSEDTLDIVNTRITETSVSKVSAGGGDELAGAVLTVTDKDGNEIERWTTGDEPHIIFGLEAGETYTLTEVSAPDGYTVAETAEFTVLSDGSVTEVVMVDAQTVTNIRKVDSESGNDLAGASLKITDSNGETVEEWVSDGTVHEILGLKAGETYTLTEVSAPDGYDVAEAVEFTVSADGSVENTVVMKDTKAEIKLDTESKDTSSEETTQSVATPESTSSNDSSSSQATSSQATSSQTTSSQVTSSQASSSTADDSSPNTGAVRNGLLAMTAISFMAMAVSGNKKRK